MSTTASTPEVATATSGCTAELTETSDGWRLTITLSNSAAADELVSAIPLGVLRPGPGEFTMSVAPNLVPGQPFDIVEVRVVLAAP